MSTGGARLRRRVIVTVVLALAMVGAASAYVVARVVDGPTRCELFAAAATERRTADVGPSTGRRIVVIGDSYSVGLGLDRPHRSWPDRLPGRVHVDGFSGSGFSASASPCGPVSYADRAHRAVRGGADLVVVEGGLNDVDRTDGAITRGFERLVTALPDHDVLVVGPPSAPQRGDRVRRVDRLLAALAARHGVAYVATGDLELSYLEDRLHLTQAGHDVFGDRVADAISR